jgi:hypothetical protein
MNSPIDRLESGFSSFVAGEIPKQGSRSGSNGRDRDPLPPSKSTTASMSYKTTEYSSYRNYYEPTHSSFAGIKPKIGS